MKGVKFGLTNIPSNWSGTSTGGGNRRKSIFEDGGGGSGREAWNKKKAII